MSTTLRSDGALRVGTCLRSMPQQRSCLRNSRSKPYHCLHPKLCRFPRSRLLLCSVEPDRETERAPYQDLADTVADTLNGTNVYLTGMMGCGKTTVGSRLAKSLNYLFLDTDALIEQAAKCTITEVFAMSGEEEFRNVETSVLRDLHQYKNLVVGTGGGIVVKRENWSYLRHGIIVFLNSDPEKLAIRVSRAGLENRPLLSPDETQKEKDPVEIAKTKLKKVYSERLEQYKNADIIVSLEDPSGEDGLASVEEVVSRILSQLNIKFEQSKAEWKRQAEFQVRGAKMTPEGGLSINEINPPGTGFGDS